MNIKDINVPLVVVASIVIFTISGVFTVEYRYVNADDMQQFRVDESIKNDRLWLEILEQKLEKESDIEHRERIKRQIERTEKSLYINMEKSQ